MPTSTHIPKKHEHERNIYWNIFVNSRRNLNLNRQIQHNRAKFPYTNLSHTETGTTCDCSYFQVIR